MKRIAALVAVLALVAAACGSGDEDAASVDPTTASTEAMSEEEMADEEMSDEEMSDDAMADDDMSDDAMSDDAMSDDSMSDDAMADAIEFTVTIENIADFAYSDAGVFAVPDGADEAGPALPGGSYSFDVLAGPGQNVSFATMFVQSNDWFFAPGPNGLPLYDADGSPIDGDVTDAIRLYDAGTEVDQVPGEGADQAPRQSGPDTGADDEDNTVRGVTDDAVPAVADLVDVSVASNGEGAFTVTITNVSDSSSLMTPLAPGAYVVHGADATPIFERNVPDAGYGLEALAEDGDPAPLADFFTSSLGVVTPLSPGAYAVHHSAMPIFSEALADRGEGLEALAEDGNPEMLLASLMAAEGVSHSGVFSIPTDAAEAGVVLPGQSYTFTFSASPGDFLSFATMFVQSNDLFFAPGASGIELFPNGSALSGDITDLVSLWDAGTEVDEPLGVGGNQAPRQAGPDTGDAQDAAVSLLDLIGSDYVSITITPAS